MLDYKEHFACFECRKAFKYAGRDTRKCPQCQNLMTRMGLDFKAPAQKELKQWKKAELLAKHGLTFDSCGCAGPGYGPATLADAKVLIRERCSTI